MTLEQARNLFEQLVQTAEQFKSPAFRTFFLRKAREDYGKLQAAVDGGRYACALQRYAKEQGDLVDVLRRQTVVYNAFHDGESNI